MIVDERKLNCYNVSCYETHHWMPYIFNGNGFMFIDPRFVNNNDLLNKIIEIRSNNFIYTIGIIPEGFNFSNYLQSAMDYLYNHIVNSELAYDNNHTCFAFNKVEKRSEDKIKEEVNNFYSLLNNNILMDLFYCLSNSNIIMYFESLDKLNKSLSSNKGLEYLFEIVKVMYNLKLYNKGSKEEEAFDKFNGRRQYNEIMECRDSFLEPEIDFRQLSE